MEVSSKILICKGPWQNKFVDQCINLSLGFAIGLESIFAKIFWKFWQQIS